MFKLYINNAFWINHYFCPLVHACTVRSRMFRLCHLPRIRSVWSVTSFTWHCLRLRQAILLCNNVWRLYSVLFTAGNISYWILQVLWVIRIRFVKTTLRGYIQNRIESKCTWIFWKWKLKTQTRVLKYLAENMKTRLSRSLCNRNNDRRWRQVYDIRSW